MKYVNLVIISVSLCLLTACLEVENDNKNEDIAQAIQTQNEILSSTNSSNNSGSPVASVTLTGIVVNALDGQAVSTTNITIIAADVVLVDSLNFVGGEFKLENIPANSDIELIIESSNDQFLSRAFFINTGHSSAVNTANDFGQFEVSAAKDMQITVINKTSGLPLAGLAFSASSHYGSSSRANKYQHHSTYNEANGIYHITIPKYLNTMVRASLDINKDGEIDYNPELYNNRNSNDLYFLSSNADESLTLYVEEEMPLTEIEFRITMIDASANIILGAEFFSTDSEGEETTSSFDTTTEQYVISANFGDYSRVEIPSFMANDISYQSASIELNKNDDDSLRVNISGALENCCYNIANTQIVELAVMPRVVNNVSSSLEVVIAANEVNYTDKSFSIFYSQAITPLASSLSLINTSGFTVIKGNDALNDVILPGTTLVSGMVDIPVSFETSLNETKLTITPVNPLSKGQDYQYNVNTLVVKSTEQSVDVNGDSLSFYIENNNDDFDINDVRLDNNNFTTNGQAITASNSAGDSSAPSDYDRSVYFYLPSSIETLQSFSMRLYSVTSDGVSYNAVRNYTLVRNGNPYNVSPLGLVKLAENETLINERLQTSIETGTAQLDSQKVYRASTSIYESDDLDNSENSLTFEYVYETKAGDVVTGTINIPVQ
ncbi:hypothetical protein [Colwellia hornerae]|uniref:Uncharacterized protein n=1 Tax=Colwellia hornerae TaxID=89402 RepID=A0A5C6Q4B7_9GAMM|nr:hypothetical protein [Colwellia hornerae]TWX56180.1 hypothetical protein ESZ28_04595 [Colwellia hornerae]TWX62031.1 hypothetical protein ESZ26_03370 [Colwellia hornerae]TWX63507.1 hypothetical protein ESZ27_16430 [Colwellia hornerae]